MMQNTLHNPDQFMFDLRQILSQGRKRIGILIGAGAPVSISVDAEGNQEEGGEPLIPDVARLTTKVLDQLSAKDKEIVDAQIEDIGGNPNIEAILTRLRQLSQAIGNFKIGGVDGGEFGGIADTICQKIGEIVAAKLPRSSNPYTELISWIGGTQRSHAVEIFTPNYDLLLEEAFEKAHSPYFDGFTGAHKPFFDPVSIASDTLPSRWSRVWKIHGSLGWDVQENTVVRTGNRCATKLIYPDHLKYDQITRQPYSSLFARLSDFLTTPDSLMLCTGFSFFDSHILAVIDEALSANAHTALWAFQFKQLSDETNAVELAKRRSNASVFARDGAVVNGLTGNWQPGLLKDAFAERIRKTYWNRNEENGEFILGDFASFTRFLAYSQANDLSHESADNNSDPVGKELDEESIQSPKEDAQQ
ncbi:SIR2 family protein [Pelagicoccus mobilis]|uniref:SIR2 family protein n=1 Tax=Pelagicoccus mobilis TaxID=415221 RepID=A0A934VNQ5_9BACT|nr:SIR2 family protein [Pelagicoccus mobilis]MBK1880206.1 SIR2 family protein [Pelagicoccus mobilis]